MTAVPFHQPDLPSLQVHLGRLVEEGVDRFLVLDFDDVLNFFPGAILKRRLGDLDVLHPRRHKFKYRAPTSGRYAISVDDDVVAALNQALADPRVQLLWLTTWNQNVLAVQHRVGLEPKHHAKVLWFSTHAWDAQGSVLGKPERLQAALQQLQGVDHSSVKVAWVDDKMADYLDLAPNAARRQALFQPLAPSQVKVWAPADCIGLLQPQAQQVAAWLLS